MTSLPPNTDALVRASRLTKHYVKGERRIDVLNGLDLEIFPGERVAIVGKSGAGKSTLLQVLGTLDAPSGGEVLIEGANVFALPQKVLAAFRNKTIGFVWQFHHLLPDFTAQENLQIPQRIAGISPSVGRERARELLAQVGLEDRLAHRPGELSGGEQQRVAIARALVMNPKLVLADEPTGNLDAQTSAGIHELLQSLNERFNTTLIVVTHNQDLADRMGRCLHLDSGRLSAHDFRHDE